jgi:hypothetical protein
MTNACATGNYDTYDTYDTCFYICIKESLAPLKNCRNRCHKYHMYHKHASNERFCYDTWYDTLERVHWRGFLSRHSQS